MSEQVLCIGGPKDGKRIELSPAMLRQGYFVVASSEEFGLRNPRAYTTVQYRIEQLADDTGRYPVAVVQSNPRISLAQALLSGYKRR